jgi:uncharacterized protein with HEPN domain
MQRDEAYLLDMLLAAKEIRELAEGKTFEEFQRDRLLQLAVMRLIQTAGEAARKVSPEFKAAHPEIPWAAIVAQRHRLVHEYFRILPAKVWEVVREDIPPLIARLVPLVPPEEP